MKFDPNAVRARMKSTYAAHSSEFMSGAIKLPEGVEWFKWEGNKILIDILPYIVSDPRHPDGIKVGDPWYTRRYYQHRDVGPEKKRVTCLAKTFGERCPICEELSRLEKDPDADEAAVNALKPKVREIFNIIDLKNPDKGIQIFDFSWHNFGKILEFNVSESDDEGVPLFWFPQGGRTLSVTFAKKKTDFGEFLEASMFQFNPRKQDYEDEVATQTVDLDAAIVHPTYEEVAKMFHGMDEVPAPAPSKAESAARRVLPGRKPAPPPEPEAEAAPEEPQGEPEQPAAPPPRRPVPTARRPAPPPPPEPEPEEPQAEEPAAEEGSEGDPPAEELQEVPANACKACNGTGKNSRGGSCLPCRGTGEQQAAVAPPPARPAPARPAAPPARTAPPPARPAAPAARPAPAPARPAAPPARPAAKAAPAAAGDTECPHGHVFGKDTDKHEECGECSVWDPCYSAKEAARKPAGPRVPVRK